MKIDIRIHFHTGRQYRRFDYRHPGPYTVIQGLGLMMMLEF